MGDGGWRGGGGGGAEKERRLIVPERGHVVVHTIIPQVIINDNHIYYPQFKC